MTRKQRDIFREKIDRLFSIMRNGEQSEIEVKDLFAPHISHFFEIYKLIGHLHIIHYRGDSSFQPSLIPIIERLIYPRYNWKKKLNFRRSRRKEIIPDYMRILPESSQVDVDELFRKLDLIILEMI